MPKANLVQEKLNVLTGRDGIIVRKHIFGIEAGRVLDPTDYNFDVVPCGVPVITKAVDAEQVYKALVPTSTGFTLPDGWEYAGIAEATVKKGQACPILTNGVVNDVALIENLKEVYGVATLTIANLTAVKSALPHIEWMRDECSDAI